MAEAQRIHFRQSDEVLAQVLAAINNLSSRVEGIDARTIEINNNFHSHMHDHDVNQRNLEAIVESIRLEHIKTLSGFPNNDPVLHRAKHVEQELSESRKMDAATKIFIGVTTVVVASIVIWSFAAMWGSFLNGPK